MANDPCGLVPDTVIPAGKPLYHRQHAIHHVIGRIRHRVKPHPGHAKHAPAASNVGGCERHATPDPGQGRGQGLGGTLLRAAPTGPALAAISGAGGAAIGGFGGYVTGRATREHKPHGNHHGDGGTPVPEPSSTLVFLFALLVGLAARRLRAP